jgi:hypothetical protein
MHTLTIDAKKQFSQIFQHLGIELDITETQYKAIVSSYEAVGAWLSAPDSVIASYKPEIIAQGSFMLGTMIPPSNGRDELDIDLICRLTGKRSEWTQYHIKQIVGERLKASGTYGKMLDKEGRRCWTLNYADSARYHMDILPSLVDQNYKLILEKALSATDLGQAQNIAIRITDKEESNYRIDQDPSLWPKSNPFGYAMWFFELARLESIKAYSLREAVQPVPSYQNEKYPLQRVVQILKWHRDQRFSGDPEKPISIVITTLAARAYEKQTDLTQALTDVASRLASMIEERYDPKHQRVIKWIANPVNPEENFADKWPENPRLEQKFYRWAEALQTDLDSILAQVGQAYYKIQAAMEKPFGQKIINRTFSKFGEGSRISRETGGLKMAATTGTLGTFGRTTVTNHNNFGADA